MQMGTIILIVYVAVGYWAVGETLYANKIVFYTGYELFARKLFFSVFLGWILIPAAIIKRLVSK